MRLRPSKEGFDEFCVVVVGVLSVVADDGDKTLDLAILGVTDWLPSSPRKI
jgi:hypothetical protein